MGPRLEMHDVQPYSPLALGHSGSGQTRPDPGVLLPSKASFRSPLPWLQPARDGRPYLTGEQPRHSRLRAEPPNLKSVLKKK